MRGVVLMKALSPMDVGQRALDIFRSQATVQKGVGPTDCQTREFVLTPSFADRVGPFLHSFWTFYRPGAFIFILLYPSFFYIMQLPPSWIALSVLLLAVSPAVQAAPLPASVDLVDRDVHVYSFIPVNEHTRPDITEKHLDVHKASEMRQMAGKVEMIEKRSEGVMEDLERRFGIGLAVKTAWRVGSFIASHHHHDNQN